MNNRPQAIEISRGFLASDPRRAAVQEKPSAVSATVGMLKHFKAFLESNYQRMNDPSRGWPPVQLNKDAAQRRLTSLVDIAVNRRAGIPDKFASELLAGKWNEILELASRLRRDDPEILARWQHLDAPSLRGLKKVVRKQIKNWNSESARTFLIEASARQQANRPGVTRGMRLV